MNRFYTWSTCFFLLSISTALLGQNTAGVASINGVVLDATGSVIPGAKVNVDNDSKGVHRVLETNIDGLFNASSLVPAPGYSVTILKDGFTKYGVKEIELAVGQTVTLKPVLTITSSTTQVEVTSEAPLVDAEKTDVSQVVNTRQIVDLPINGRRVDSFVLLTPGVTTDASFGLLTFRGNPGGNSFLTDGNDTTNSFYDENAGRTRTFNISQDAVQEFQVITSNFTAEYGHASGGVVNTITRSGSNEYHGTAYWFFRNRTLNATDITTHGINPQDWRHQAGASIGGPINKDKLFFFFNGELQRRYFPIVSSNINNNYFDANGNYLVDTPGTTKPNCAVSPSGPTQAQCNAAIAYLQSRVEPQAVPRNSDVNLLFGKVDYQLDNNNRLTWSFNYVDFRSPNGIQTQLSLTNGAAVGNNANTTVFDRTGKFGWTSTLSPNTVNEARFGYFKDRQYDPNSPSLLPSVGPIGLSLSGLSNIGYATGYNRLDPSEQRVQFADTLSYNVGRHNLKFGFDYSHVEDFVKRLTNPYGSYSFPSLTAFALDFSGNLKGSKDWSSFSQNFGNPQVDTNVNESSLFIQDEWHLTPKLTLSPGIRYEYTAIPQPTQVNPAFPETGHIPGTVLNWAPRLGAAYAINEKTAIRAGYGIFYNRYVTGSIESFFTTNGLYQTSYSLSGSKPAQLAAGPVFPFALPAPPTGVQGSSSIAFADSSFRNAYSEQAEFSVERQIAHNTSFTASYIWSRGLHIISARDANAPAPSGTYTYPILNAAQTSTVGSYTTPVYLYANRLNPAYGSIIDVDSDNNTYYNGLTLNVQKRYTKWFQASAAYTWSHTIDYAIGGGGNTLFAPSYATSVFNGNYSGEKGSSSTDQRHRLVVTAVMNPKFTSGTSWFERNVVNGWQLSVLSQFGSAFALAPTISANSSTTPSYLYNNSSINGLGGSLRVPFESTSALNIDQLYRTDARLSKILTVTERVKVTLMFEGFNVFNHPYIAGSAPLTTEQYFTVKYNGGYALAPFLTYGGGQIQTQAVPDGTTARRAQAAIRIEF